MRKARTPSITVGILTGILCLSQPVFAGSPTPLSGSILGHVKGAAGVAEMGATVVLFNRYDQVIRQALSNEDGKFAFTALAPDLYSIRVTLASFMPALRRNIAVTTGSESLLQINMASVLSTVELVSSGGRGTLMTDDWKWVLRSSHSTRPILRFAPDPVSSSTRALAGIFSDTQGIVKLSAGHPDSSTGTNQQDLGTAFALATSVFGSSRLQFSGNLGYAANVALPATSFSTTYSRRSDVGSNPEVTLTVRQMYLPTGPALRTMSLGTLDKFDVLDNLHLEYGFNFESVTFVRRLNYASPFARVTYDLGNHGSVRLAFSSGTQPAQLLARSGDSGAETSSVTSDALNQDLRALAFLPRVSLRDGSAQVERTESFEAGYQYVVGSRSYSASIYREAVSNAAFTLSGPANFLSSSDLMPELGSGSQVFNIGNYQRTGYSAAVTQSLGDHFDASVAAGRGGALVSGSPGPGSSDPSDANDLRGLIHKSQRAWVTARVSSTLRATGTRVSSSYGWTDFSALLPAHLSLTERSGQDIGWNIYVRQPLPALPGMFGRFEASAELCNLLAQGYLPLFANGQQAVLTNSPRAVRGGLSFIF